MNGFFKFMMPERKYIF